MTVKETADLLKYARYISVAWGDEEVDFSDPVIRRSFGDYEVSAVYARLPHDANGEVNEYVIELALFPTKAKQETL